MPCSGGWLWWLADDETLGERPRDLIADPGNDVLVSAVSLWEIVVKIRIGKLTADIGAIAQSITGEGFTPTGITPAHRVTLRSLPLHPDHRDPFDPLLIAQAVTEEATFVSQDRNTPRYPVRFVTCSDSPSR